MTNTFENYVRVAAHVRAKKEFTVNYHGFRELPCGGQEYEDDEDEIDGWTSFVRIETPDDPIQPMDLLLEADHSTKEEAIKRAKTLAHAFTGNPDQYETY